MSDEDNPLEYLELEMALASQAQAMGRDHNWMIQKMRSVGGDLVIAYAKTNYVADFSGDELVINICKPLPAALAELLKTLPVASCAVITGYNPYSGLHEADSNAARQQLLAKVVEQHGYNTFPAMGRSEDGQWEEPSILIAGISYDLAAALGASFQQNAVVFAEADGPAELIFCEKDEWHWPGSEPG